jgi:hypothetical protein
MKQKVATIIYDDIEDDVTINWNRVEGVNHTLIADICQEAIIELEYIKQQSIHAIAADVPKQKGTGDKE